jgi:hypothetical protein
MKLDWTGLVALTVIVAGAIVAYYFGADELSTMLTGILLGSFSPSPWRKAFRQGDLQTNEERVTKP